MEVPLTLKINDLLAFILSVLVLYVSTVCLVPSTIFDYFTYHLLLLVFIFLIFRTITLSISVTHITLCLVIFSKKITLSKTPLNDTNKIAFVTANLKSLHAHTESLHVIDTKHHVLLRSIPPRNFNASIHDIKKFCLAYNMHTITLSDQDYYENYYLPKHSMGKKAGYLAYGCILLIILAIVFAFLDPYQTLDFGNLYYIVGGLTAIMTGFAAKYIYIDKNYFARQFPIFFIFIPCMYAMLFFFLLAISPLFAKTHQETFVANANKITKQNMVWQQQDGELEIVCHYVKHAMQEAKPTWTRQVKLYKTMTVTRVIEKCPR